MTPFKKIKEDLKNLAHNIRAIRRAERESQSKNQPYKTPELKPTCCKERWVGAMSWEFRHRHIAYCLLRGTARELIERPKEENKPREDYIEKYLAEYRAACTPEVPHEAETLCASQV